MKKNKLAQENAIMAEIGRIISSSLNIEEVYERFAEEVWKVIPFDRIVIDLGDREHRAVPLAYVTGIDIAGRRSGDVMNFPEQIKDFSNRQASRGQIVKRGFPSEKQGRIAEILQKRFLKIVGRETANEGRLLPMEGKI